MPIYERWMSCRTQAAGGPNVVAAAAADAAAADADAAAADADAAAAEEQQPLSSL